MRQLWRLKLCWEYLGQKCDFAALITVQKRNAGQLLHGDVLNTYLKNAVAEKMTFFCQSKGSEMEPTISANETLFVRKLPYLNARLRGNPQHIHVGDVVVLKDPLNSNNYVVRRLAAVSGYEMVSTNKDDESFVLKDGQCWVLSDNKNLKPEESNDSRTYGPISITNIVGRVIYRFQTAKDHNIVVNSAYSLQNDRSVLFVELDPAEVQLNNDKNTTQAEDWWQENRERIYREFIPAPPNSVKPSSRTSLPTAATSGLPPLNEDDSNANNAAPWET